MNIDEIVNQSRASIEREDLRILLQILMLIKPKRIVELGAWRGYSAYNWIKAFEPVSFVTIEKEEKYKIDNAEIEMLDKSVELRDIGIQYWYGSDSHDLHTLQTLRVYIPTVDFLFIDADHSYEGVKKDWEMYSPLVRKGGIVALHDVCYHADKTEEVDLFWNELKPKYNYIEIKSSLSSTGMGLIFL